MRCKFCGHKKPSKAMFRANVCKVCVNRTKPEGHENTPALHQPAVTPEPAPVRTDSPAVWPLVIRSLLEGEVDEARARVVERLAADMGARDAEGQRKYGVPLQVENGRDAAVDAYQEALDLTVYARQQWERHHTRVWWLIYTDALWIAWRICAELMEPRE